MQFTFLLSPKALCTRVAGFERAVGTRFYSNVTQRVIEDPQRTQTDSVNSYYSRLRSTTITMNYLILRLLPYLYDYDINASLLLLTRKLIFFSVL